MAKAHIYIGLANIRRGDWLFNARQQLHTLGGGGCLTP